MVKEQGWPLQTAGRVWGHGQAQSFSWQSSGPSPTASTHPDGSPEACEPLTRRSSSTKKTLTYKVLPRCEPGRARGPDDPPFSAVLPPSPPPRVRGLRPSAGSRTGTAVVRHRFSGGPHQRRVLRPCVLGVRRMPAATPVCSLLFILRPPWGGVSCPVRPSGPQFLLGCPKWLLELC